MRLVVVDDTRIAYMELWNKTAMGKPCARKTYGLANFGISESAPWYHIIRKG